jgi:hypothetical protein
MRVVVAWRRIGLLVLALLLAGCVVERCQWTTEATPTDDVPRVIVFAMIARGARTRRL